MDLKKILTALNEIDSASSPLTESKNPATNRLSVAEQMAMQHYQKPAAKKPVKPIIDKYFEEVKKEADALTEENLTRAYNLSKRVMEKMYPGTLSRHISQSKNPSDGVKSSAKRSASKIIGEADQVDTVTVDIPLLMRLLEYAREDAKHDVDLHLVAEKLIELGKEHGSLSMAQYDDIINNVSTDNTNQNEY